MSAQPIKKGGPYQKPRSKTVKKRTKPSVSEIIKKNIEQSKKPHPKYGTSKLETKFAKEFLDKLGIKYETQYEAKDIKRFYDFAAYTEYGTLILIECDGCYWHGKGLLHEEKNYQQKKAEYVDKIKDEWARARGIKLIRIWEDDINENPQKVFKILRETFDIVDKQDDKKKRH